MNEQVGGMEEERAARKTDNGEKARFEDTIAGNFPGLKRDASD